MNTSVLAIAVLLAALTFTSGCGSAKNEESGKQSSKEPIKIGANFPFSINW